MRVKKMLIEFGLKPLAICVLAFGAVSAHAQQGGGHDSGGEEDEGPGSNLSFPNLFAEGIGMAGTVIDPNNQATTGLRVVPIPPGHNLTGAFWYVWGPETGPEVCNPAASPLNCPPSPAPVDLRRAHVQRDLNNSWQADWAVPSSQVDVGTIDWGDNIESHTWSTKQRQIRVEVGLTKSLDSTLTGDLMAYLSGKGQTELWGVVSPDSIPGTPVTYESAEATVFSPCARLGIQKVFADAGDPGTPPGDVLTWNAASAQWDGPAFTVFNGAVWEGFGSDGPTTKFAAEVNVKGKIVYGFNWKINDMVLPPSYRKVGWYRLTFSMDGTAADGKQCGTFPLNTSLANAVIAVSEEEEEASAAEAGGEEPASGFTAHVDPVNNLTYIDVYLVPGLGESVDNHAPICNAGTLYGLSCAGLTTNVFLSADGSFDPDGDSLSFKWTHDCVDGIITDSTVQNPVLGLTLPGTGVSQSCIATLKVTELDLSSPNTVECSAQITIDPCPVDCYSTPFGLGELDECGKCGGTNECFDCTGKAFGTSTIDRCGVCGGDGTLCLGCTGVQVSTTLSEIKLRSREQLRLIRRAVLKLRQATHNRRYARNRLVAANRLTANNASLDTVINSVVNSCTNKQFCVRQDHSSALKEFRRNALRLDFLLGGLTQELARGSNARLARDMKRRGSLLLSRIRRRIGSIPPTEDVCF